MHTGKFAAHAEHLFLGEHFRRTVSLCQKVLKDLICQKFLFTVTKSFVLSNVFPNQHNFSQAIYLLAVYLNVTILSRKI